MSKISSDTVKKVAQLANLPISQDEEKIFVDQLAKIVDYVDQLNLVDTSNIEPTYNTTGLKSVFRDDRVLPCQTQEEALQNAPNKMNGLFLTKGVFEEE